MSTQSFIQKFSSSQKLNRVRFYIRLFCLLALFIILAVWLEYWFRGEIGIAKKFAEFVDSQWGSGILIGGGILYILLLSLPFVPGVELGVILMCVFGKEGIVFVYFATVAGLCLAFFVGRLLPREWIESRLQKFGYSQTCDGQVGEVDGMLDQPSLNHLFCKNRFWSFLSKYRYLAIGVLFNTPGNYLIGGGGRHFLGLRH